MCTQTVCNHLVGLGLSPRNLHDFIGRSSHIRIPPPSESCREREIPSKKRGLGTKVKLGQSAKEVPWGLELLYKSVVKQWYRRISGETVVQCRWQYITLGIVQVV